MSNENTGVETTENDITTAETNTETVAETAAKVKRTPAWEAFAAAITTHAQALGLTVVEQAGFLKVLNTETKHRLDIAKQSKSVKLAATTLDILGQSGTHPLAKPNGRITCTVDTDMGIIEGVLSLLANETSKLPAPKRQPKTTATETAAPTAE